MYLEEKISIQYISNHLTVEERRVMLYFLDNEKEIINKNANEIADALFTTTTTINRLCKKMDLVGYTELRSILKYEAFLKQNIKKSNHISSYKQVVDFVNTIDFNEKYIILGTGFSAISAEYLYTNLLYLGYNVYLSREGYLGKYLDDYNIIYISNSGKGSNLIENLTDVVYKNIFSITKENSYLDKKSDISITHNKDTDATLYNRRRQAHMIKIIDEILEICYQKNGLDFIIDD